MKHLASAAVLSLFFTAASHASVINTNNVTVVTTFQTGATVVNFTTVTGVTAFSITAYTNGVAVPNSAKVFDQVPGVQFSVGGMVGVNTPALYSLGGGIAGDAKSASNVLGPVDFSFTTLFGPGSMIEMFFPTKVDRVGFWLNPSLGNVTLIAADTNFAFSHLPETTLESGTGTAGNFVGIQRATAEIGGFKVLGANGFTLDDLTFNTGSVVTTPEPSSLLLIGMGVLALYLLSRRKNEASE